MNILSLWEHLITPIDFTTVKDGTTIADVVVEILKAKGLSTPHIEKIAVESRRGYSQDTHEFKRRENGGLRKCPGHKKMVTYIEKHGALQCPICGGFIKT